MSDLNNLSDKKIVELSLKDSDNFVHIMKRYTDPLKRYICRIASFSYDEAEDVLQEVFIKVYRNLNAYNGDFSFSSWIYRITHNEVIDYVRKTKVRPMIVSVNDEDIDVLINLMPAEIDIEKDVKKRELAKFVNKMLSELNEKYRSVLILRYLEDKSYEEISDILKKSVGTVSTLINRAKKKLKLVALSNKSLISIYE